MIKYLRTSDGRDDHKQIWGSHCGLYMIQPELCVNWNSLTHGLSHMPHTCALTVSNNALKIGSVPPVLWCPINNPHKLEVLLLDTRVMLTCCVHDNPLHGCTPLMFGVCPLF